MTEKLYIGTAGWSYADWKGVVYPTPPPKGFHGLKFLSAYFNCIEINSTFYRPPSQSTTRQWAAIVSKKKEFLFTLKLYQGFTHKAELSDQSLVRAFKEGADVLAGAQRLGALLLQFPWFFKDGDSEREKLFRLCDTFREYPLVVEVRNNSWTRAESLAFLESLNVGFCNIDQPLAKTSIQPGSVAMGKVGYVRFHGRNYEKWFDRKAGRDEKYNYLYTSDELNDWVGKIEDLNRKTEYTFVITNNHYRGQAPTNALELRHKLSGKKVDVPPQLLTTYPRLKAVAREPEQGELF